MRINYLKDITHLKDFMFVKDNYYEGAEYIDVRFFEATKDISDENMQLILNEKLSSMAIIFNSKLNKVLKINEKYHR